MKDPFKWRVRTNRKQIPGTCEIYNDFGCLLILNPISTDIKYMRELQDKLNRSVKIITLNKLK